MRNVGTCICGVVFDKRGDEFCGIRFDWENSGRGILYYRNVIVFEKLLFQNNVFPSY